MAVVILVVALPMIASAMRRVNRNDLVRLKQVMESHTCS